MRNNLKKVGLFLLAGGCCLSLAAGVSSLTTVKAETLPTMINGASIRLTSGSTGMRFSMKVASDANYVATEDANNYGMLIVPKDYLDDNNITSDYIAGLIAKDEQYLEFNDLKPTNVIKPLDTDTESDYYVHASIGNIKYGNLNRDFVGIGYIKNETSYEYVNYLESNARNVAYIASAALYHDVKVPATYTSTQEDILKEFVYLATYQSQGVEEEQAKTNLNTDTPDFTNDTKSSIRLELKKTYTLSSIDLFAETSNKDVAIVEDGIIKPVGKGDCTISYWDNDEIKTMNVHCYDMLEEGISSPTADKGVPTAQYEAWARFTGYAGYGAYTGDVTIGGETKSGEFYKFKAYNWDGYVTFMPDCDIALLKELQAEGYALEMDVGLQGLYSHKDGTESTFKSSYSINVLGTPTTFKVNEWTTVKMDLGKYITLAEGFKAGTLKPTDTGLLGYTWTNADTESVYSNCYVTNIRLYSEKARVLEEGISSPTADKGVPTAQYEAWARFTGYAGYGAYTGDVTIGGETKSGEFYKFKAYNWDGYVTFMPDCDIALLKELQAEGYALEMDVGLQGLYSHKDGTESTFKSSYSINVLGTPTTFKVNEWTTVKMDLGKYITLAEGFKAGTLKPTDTGLLGYTWTNADTASVYSNCYVTNIRLYSEKARVLEEGISSPTADKGVPTAQYEAWARFTGYAGYGAYTGDVTIGGETKSGEFYKFKAYNWDGYVTFMPDCDIALLKELQAEGYALEMDVGLQGLYSHKDNSESTLKTAYTISVLGTATTFKVNEWTTVKMDLAKYITLAEGFKAGTLKPADTGLLGYTWTSADTASVYSNCYVTNIRLVKNA